MHEGNEFETAFLDPYCLFQSRVMPFELDNAPGKFLASNDNWQLPYIDDFTMCYVDDIQMYPGNEKE